MRLNRPHQTPPRAWPGDQEPRAPDASRQQPSPAKRSKPQQMTTFRNIRKKPGSKPESARNLTEPDKTLHPGSAGRRGRRLWFRGRRALPGPGDGSQAQTHKTPHSPTSTYIHLHSGGSSATVRNAVRGPIPHIPPHSPTPGESFSRRGGVPIDPPQLPGPVGPPNHPPLSIAIRRVFAHGPRRQRDVGCWWM